MVQINFANKEIQCKVVYYGPGMSGKTTNLEVVHQKAPQNSKGDLTSIATEGDRTLFFDFMPLDLGNIAGIKTKFQLYTVPGQVYYNSTRKLVLQGVDGIVFVADSQADKIQENIDAFENLRANLREYGREIEAIPLVMQWNKRDLPTALTVEELDQRLNSMGAPSFEAVASTGEGVFPTLKALASLVLESINREKQGASTMPRSAPVAKAAPPRSAPVPAPAAAAVPAGVPGTQAAPAARRAPPQRTPAGRPAPAAATRRPAPARPAAAAAPGQMPPRARPAAAAATVGASRQVGKVKIKERTDTGRLVLTLVVAGVIIGAVAFVVLNYM